MAAQAPEIRAARARPGIERQLSIVRKNLDEAKGRGQIIPSAHGLDFFTNL
jgi:hypothetical protein